MEGISKQYLKNSLVSINDAPIDDAIKSAFVILVEKLIAECQELQEPWMTLDEFLKSGFVGFCWIRQADYIENSYFDGETFFESSTGSHCYQKYSIELVMPIPKPEPPR